MRGKGMMRGLSQPSSSFRKKTLRSCSTKGKYQDVVFIDVDGDPCENVIIIDAPESVENDLQGSSGSKGGQSFPSPGVISIDDDETDDVDDPEICGKCGGDVDSDASSSKNFAAPDFVPKPANLDDDECQVIREKRPTFKLSKCKKTYSGKTSCGKRFGLSPESEDTSSESDCSDCELEGSFGKLREQWEKAFQKKNNARNGQSDLEDQTSASGSHGDTPPTVEENRTEQCVETPESCGLSDSNTQKQNSSAFKTSADKHSGGSHVNHEMRSPFVASDEKINHENFSQSKYGPTVEAQYSHVQTDDMMKDPPPSVDGGQEFHWAPLNSDPYTSDLHHGKTGSNGKEKLQSEEPSMPIPKFSEERQVEDHMTPSNIRVGTSFHKFAYDKAPLGNVPLVSNNSNFDRENVVSGSGDGSQYAETQIKHSCSKVRQSCTAPVTASKEGDERDTLHAQGFDATAPGEKEVIVDREKLKETDEYKRAAQEEEASRQHVLQLQAEEAQRLRKRRKAERMRLLDMERRQKQRLEEIRETQKKDEENMNLKERLRMEVRKELSKLELSCIDMASLLRSLGILVGGGLCPQEVHAAYKRALLRFHPDRASKTDIRQQVEAEEKFKLIARMKDKFKFLATPCH
ncbi:hypothetical protein CCACVL1_06437 [Corchorus capsularis]|uniref:J domain-containing protein n=1 Tax=Corchorus capsularis TaxID=210143 RepID=A0A1R3JFK1_COCAP|nr:hypothetical protein CCACVL1_06437 [Corchorus capsularis]